MLIPNPVNLLEPFIVQQLVYKVILKIIDRVEDNDIPTPLSLPLSIIFEIMHGHGLNKHFYPAAIYSNMYGVCQIPLSNIPVAYVSQFYHNLHTTVLYTATRLLS